jgi:RHS repeat-associated protein
LGASGAGFTLTHSVNAAQQITQITSSLNDSSHPPNLAQSITYTPFGALSTVVNGCAGSGCTQVQETYDYNNRLQPVRLQLGTSGTPDANYCLVYNYYYPSLGTPTSCTIPAQATANNDGLVNGYYYQDNVNSSLSHSTAFAYDPLKRLTSAVATGSSTYNLLFTYDRYGNMACQTNGSTNGPCPNWTFSATTNQITTSGFTYDAAGDLTGDGTHTYQWDAEGRLSSVDSGSTTQATYNALTQQVQRVVTGTTYDYLFGLDNRSMEVWKGSQWWDAYVRLPGRPNFLAYDFSSNQSDFMHANALGSLTTVTNASGTTSGDELYYPWGELWTAVTGTPAYYWGGFDYWNWESDTGPTLYRTYAFSEGRWLSPDPLGGDLSNPQSLNRYAYVLNNPATFVDPLGLDCSQVTQIGTDENGNPIFGMGCNSGAAAPPDSSLSWLFCSLGFGGCGGSSPILSYPTAAPPQSVGGSGGGGGSNPPPPKPPAPKPTPLSNTPWLGAFANVFVANFPETTWNSLASSNGCLNQFFSNTLSNLSPLPPSASSLAEPAANFTSALKFNSALAYAASQPNVLGGAGLLYPFKSSVFRGMLSTSLELLDTVPVLQLVAAEGQALYTEGATAWAGQCQ